MRGLIGMCIKKPQSLIADRQNRGFFGLLAARALQLGNGFLISIALVHSFGLAAAGTYAVASLGLTVLALVSGLGLVAALPRQSLSDPQRAAAGLVITAVLLLPSLAASFLYGRVMASTPQEAIAIAVFAFSGFFVGQSNILLTLYILQKRTEAALVPPIATTAGIVVAIFCCNTVVGFAIAILVGRCFGNIIGAAVLRYARISTRQLWSVAAHGSSFAPIDVIAMLSEQVPIVILSALLTRGEMGIIGLSRQILTAADTPGWSFMQSKYPEIVENSRRATRAIAHANERLSLLTGGFAFALSAVLGFFVYRQPVLVAAMAVLLAMLPARYMNNLCDQIMRAGGWIRESVGLAILKLALSLALFSTFTAQFGLWGAIAASALLSLVSGVIYRLSVGALAPGLMPSFRKKSFA